jgi:glycosyltransferase involved in cell wall biosynthesis
MTIPVSVIVLTHNEESEIADCVQMICKFSDDIHVLDSFSNDQTIFRAEQAGAKTHQNSFSGFGDQRNWAIDHIATKYDWQLHLDADERPTEAFVNELSRITNSNSDAAGYLVPNKLMLNSVWLKHSSGYPVYQVRLFHKRRLRFVNHGHGQREVTDGKLVRMKEPYLHYGFSKGIEAWLAKHAKYANQEAIESLQNRGSLLKSLCQVISLEPVKRRRGLKALSHYLPARPLLRFLEVLILRKAILDGKAGITYAKMMATYESMTDVCKAFETLRTK